MVIEARYARLIRKEDAPDRMDGHVITDESLKEPAAPPRIQFNDGSGRQKSIRSEWFSPPLNLMVQQAARLEYGGRAVSELVLCQLAYRLENEAEFKAKVERSLNPAKPETPKGMGLAELFRGMDFSKPKQEETVQEDDISEWF